MDPVGSEKGRRRGPFHLEPDLLPLLVAAMLGGIVLGAGTFVIGSSRGLDQLGVAAFISLVATVALLLMLVIGLGRIVLLQEPRLLLAAGMLLVGSMLGDVLAFRLVPGDTTDGTAMIGLAEAVRGEGATPNTLVTCVWDRPGGTVSEVVTRRTFGLGDAPFPATMGLDLREGRFRVTRFERDQPVITFTGTMTSTADPPGHAGEVTALTTESTEILGPSGETAPPGGAAAQPVLGVRWECPALP